MKKKKILKDISLAVDTIDYGVNDFGFDTSFMNIYSFSNENLAGYLRKNNFKNKTALTVGSSADQILNLIHYGCSQITLVDINPFVKYYYELKKAAIFCLTCEEYLGFFCDRSRTRLFGSNPFEKRIYKKISEYLSQESQMFWGELLRKYHSRILKRYLFVPGELSKNDLIANNEYLCQDNFRDLRQKMMEVELSFVREDILKYDFGEAQYDYILLSNVFDYLFNIVVANKDSGEFEIPLNTKIKYLEFVKKVIEALKNEGKLFFNYRWDVTEHDSVSYQAVDKLFRSQDSFREIMFEGSNHLRYNIDSIYMYTKKR